MLYKKCLCDKRSTSLFFLNKFNDSVNSTDRLVEIGKRLISVAYYIIFLCLSTFLILSLFFSHIPYICQAKLQKYTSISYLTEVNTTLNVSISRQIDDLFLSG